MLKVILRWIDYLLCYLLLKLEKDTNTIIKVTIYNLIYYMQLNTSLTGSFLIVLV